MKIMFVCHGNICRSPLAEFMFKDMLLKRGLQNKYEVSSSAISTEELGNPVHYAVKQMLKENNIPFGERYAVQLKKSDSDKYDLFICMDKYNLKGAKAILRDCEDAKIHLLMEYAGMQRDVADPWYTRNFNDAYEDIKTGLDGLLKKLEG